MNTSNNSPDRADRPEDYVENGELINQLRRALHRANQLIARQNDEIAELYDALRWDASALAQRAESHA
jgi:hypothetical protein